MDEVEAAHRAVGGAGRGRRYATQQINQAYVVLLSSRFQAFCRDLHSEAVTNLAAFFQPSALRGALQAQLTNNRHLDRGNPTPGNIGSDFGRLGIGLWQALQGRRRLNSRRQALLDEMVHWRNAISHQDFSKPELGGATSIGLSKVRRFRRACAALAIDLDAVLRDHLHSVAGPACGW